MGNWKFLKIFVSSTFRDMDVERDVLKNMTEPQLNEYLKEYGCSVELIDLRHSVKTSPEMSVLEREKQIFNICLEEIDNCRPFFMGIMGHRYGWIPQKDGVQTPNIKLPAGFPIKEEELSVTMFEFLHGIFSEDVDKNRCIIFLRYEDSYSGLDTEEKLHYVDNSENLGHIEKARHFIEAQNQDMKISHYSIPLSSYTDSDLLRLSDYFFHEILKLIKQEINKNRLTPYEDFILTQEGFVQQHLKHFLGRESELAEFYEEWEMRQWHILAADGRGEGLTSFFCKIYDDFRKSGNKICLMWGKREDTDYRMEDVIYYWLIYLADFLQEELPDLSQTSTSHKERLVSLWNEYTSRLVEKGYEIFAFVEDFQLCSSLNNWKLKNLVIITTLVYNPEYELLRPRMFVIGEYDAPTIRSISAQFRNPVIDAVLDKPSSGNARWLAFALNIINKLNKLDYNQIRKRRENDNEERILNHQLELIKDLPDDIEDMLMYWIERVKIIFGSRLIDNYLFLLSINPSGWKESTLSAILDCDLVDLKTIRNLLGSMIITQSANGLWIFKNDLVREIFSEKYNLSEFLTLTEKAYRHLKDLAIQTAEYEDIIFRLALINKDADFCYKYISSYSSPDSKQHRIISRDLEWLAEFYVTNFFATFSHLLQLNNKADYQFFDNLIGYLAVLDQECTENAYITGLDRISDTLKVRWIQGEIDLHTYSLCYKASLQKARRYSTMGEHEKLLNELNNILSNCGEHYEKDSDFLTHYLHAIAQKLGFFNRKPEEGYKWLQEIFITPELQGKFNYGEIQDTFTYAYLLFKVVVFLLLNDQEDVAEKFCNKSFDVLFRLLENLRKRLVKSRISEITIMDFLSNSLLFLLKFHFHYDFMSWEKVEEICNRTFEECSSLEKHKEDIDSTVNFYKAKAAYYFLQNISTKEKFYALMKLRNQIIKNLHDTIDPENYIIAELNQSSISPVFEAWLYTQALAMFSCAADPVDEDLRIPREESAGNTLFTRNKNEIFKLDSYITFLLGIIERKKESPDYLMSLYDSILILFSSYMLCLTSKEQFNSNDLYFAVNYVDSIIESLREIDSTVPIDEFILIFNDMLEQLDS